MPERQDDNSPKYQANAPTDIALNGPPGWRGLPVVGGTNAEQFTKCDKNTDNHAQESAYSCRYN